MTKREYLEAALKAGGIRGRIYGSVKDMKTAQGTYYAAILRASDKPARAASKRTYRDQEGVPHLRRKLYECETTYNIVIASAREEQAEEILEGFLSALGRGYYDDRGNWVAVEPGESDWVDEEDSILKAKSAVQIPVQVVYGIYQEETTTSVDGIQIRMEVE